MIVDSFGLVVELNLDRQYLESFCVAKISFPICCVVGSNARKNGPTGLGGEGVVEDPIAGGRWKAPKALMKSSAS